MTLLIPGATLAYAGFIRNHISDPEGPVSRSLCDGPPDCRVCNNAVRDELEAWAASQQKPFNQHLDALVAQGMPSKQCQTVVKFADRVGYEWAWKRAGWNLRRYNKS